MSSLRPSTLNSDTLLVRLLSAMVLLYGLTLFADILGIRIVGHSLRHANSFSLSAALLAALSLMYVSTRMLRRKQTSVWAALAIMCALLVFNLSEIVDDFEPRSPHLTFQRIALPVAIISLLYIKRKLFHVRSDIQSFRVAVRAAAIVLIAVFAYGVSGFTLLDERDFHHDISATSAVHHTLDQLDLTTNDHLTPYTKRGRVFLDSLSLISTASLIYVAVSLFRPIQVRYGADTIQREAARSLLTKYGGSSEDVFALWPHDKHYFFDRTRRAGLAYKARRGVALVVGDPFGNTGSFSNLLREFRELCTLNDWQPAFVHVTETNIALYREHGFAIQKIGEEAIVDLEHFVTIQSREKYFRQINNRFVKNGYTTELMMPPHSDALLSRLKEVSDDWLQLPGRAERGFMLGYFDEGYLQQGPVMVLRDEAGTIQAFVNQIESFDSEEANFDLLRHSSKAIGNSNDFLMLAFAAVLRDQGFKRLNTGLCPLAGIQEDEAAEPNIITNALQFLYDNGNRFYSFEGLRRYKSKYAPTWEPRYIAYTNGIRGFTKAVTALNAAMKVR